MKKTTPAVSYSWKLRLVMAEHNMFSTTELQPLLAARGVELSREQVYRLVAKVPERLSLTTLAALCDILDCSPNDLIEPLSHSSAVVSARSRRASVRDITPRRARVATDPTR